MAKFGIIGKNFLRKWHFFDERKIAFLAAKSFGAYLLHIWTLFENYYSISQNIYTGLTTMIVFFCRHGKIGFFDFDAYSSSNLKRCS